MRWHPFERRRTNIVERYPAHPSLGGVPPLPVATSLEVLRTPAFQLFLLSTIATTTGLWFFETSLYWVALTRTGSATATGLVLTALIFPILVLVVPMGVVTDRLGDKRLLLVAQAAWVATMLGAALVASRGLMSFPVALAFALVEGFFDAVWVVPAQVLLARLVERPLMAKAIALGTLNVAFGRIVGGYGAGFLLFRAGPPTTFLFGAGSLAVAFLFMSLVRPAHELPRRPHVATFADGLRFVRDARPALALYAVGSCTALFVYGYLSILPVVSRELLHAGSQGMGLMTAAGGVGTLGAVWIIDPLGRRFGRGVALLGSVAVASLAIALIAISTSVGVSVVVAGVITGSLMFYTATNTTLLQALAPPELRGRVLAFFGFAFWAIMPVGSVGSGFVADHLGVRTALLIMAGLTLLALSI
ncbi:MAG TPA: MFS transporter, partial [Candidatus Dormibacteraeota bacterium]|nr:MFS transporter [Candidatus Dormibacteraeota bacterium]